MTLLQSVDIFYSHLFPIQLFPHLFFIFSKYICSLHHVIERGKHCLCWWIQTHDVILVADIIFNPLLILFLKIFYYYLFFYLFLFHSLISNTWAVFQALNLHCNDVFVWWCSSWCADSSLITSANVNRKNMSVGHRERTGWRGGSSLLWIWWGLFFMFNWEMILQNKWCHVTAAAVFRFYLILISSVRLSFFIGLFIYLF